MLVGDTRKLQWKNGKYCVKDERKDWQERSKQIALSENDGKCDER